MKKRILSITLCIVMLMTVLCTGVSAHSARALNSYIGETHFNVTTSNGTKVGEASYDFGTVSEPGAYASCARTSSSYEKAYCKLISYNDNQDPDNDEYVDMDFGYHSTDASCYISVSYVADNLKGIWKIYNPDSNNLIPSNSPSATRTFNWQNY